MFEDKPLDEDEPRKLLNQKRGGGSGGARQRETASSGASGQPNFVILRTAKIKAIGNLGGSLQHTFRERETPNADEARREENQILVGPDTADGVVKAWQERAPEKIRKNAVLGIEYLVTASPEAMARMSRPEQDQYFARAVSWLKEKHGSENVLSAVVHRDETTPHLTAMVIPLDGRGKLNAREFLGGRQKLREMQTEFTERVGRAHGLDRGIEGSKARHQRVQSFYSALERGPEASVSLPERRTGGFLGRGGETDAEYRERASEAATSALRAAQDRMTAASFAMQRENERVQAEARRAAQDRDAARQEAEGSRKTGSLLYALGRILDSMERTPTERNADNFKIVDNHLENAERSAAAPTPQISKDIRDRMHALGWRDRSEEERRPEQVRPDRSQRTTDLEQDRPRDTGRER